MSCNQIVVLSRVEAEEFAWSYPWCCISIANSEDLFALLQSDNRVGLLQLAFADITQPTTGFAAFHDSHAHDIWDFVAEHWGSVDLMIIHCDAGISRSSAVAAVISRTKFGTEGEFVDAPFDPNPRVYRILREVASGRADCVDNLESRRDEWDDEPSNDEIAEDRQGSYQVEFERNDGECDQDFGDE